MLKVNFLTTAAGVRKIDSFKGSLYGNVPIKIAHN